MWSTKVHGDGCGTIKEWCDLDTASWSHLQYRTVASLSHRGHFWSLNSILFMRGLAFVAFRNSTPSASSQELASAPWNFLSLAWMLHTLRASPISSDFFFFLLSTSTVCLLPPPHSLHRLLFSLLSLHFQSLYSFANRCFVVISQLWVLDSNLQPLLYTSFRYTPCTF